MTKDEAIQLFKEMESKEMYWQLQELCDLAIEALSADAKTIEPSTTNHENVQNCGGDLISRAEVLGYIERVTNSGLGKNKSLDYIGKYVERMPSISAEPISQTDSLIIADALRYLALDTERHLSDRTRADALRQQVLKHGASLSAEPKGELVRCKDCRWYKVGKSEVDSWQLCGHPCRDYENVTDDDFCSWAERRE